MKIKKCLICEKEFEQTSFGKKYCSQKCINKEYYQKNKEKELFRNKKWREKNKERREDYRKDYCKKNKEKIKAKRKEWRKKNPCYSKEIYRKHKAQNPDKIKQWRKASDSKRRLNPSKQFLARRKVSKFKIPEGTQCQICEWLPAKGMHHPDYDKPYEVVYLCNLCHARVENRFNPYGGISND